MTTETLTTPPSDAEISISTAPILPDSQRKLRGKIAELPKAQRDQINRLIEDGATYKEVIAVMQEEHSVALNPTNLTRWFNSGFQDYIRHQDFLAEVRTVREGAGDMLEQAEILKLHQAANQLSVLQIFKTLRDDTLKDDHVNRIRAMNALSRLSREALVFKKYEDALVREKQQISLKAGVGVEPQSKEQLETALLDKADDYFGLKSSARLRAEWAAATGGASVPASRPPSSLASSRESDFAPIPASPATPPSIKSLPAADAHSGLHVNPYLAVVDNSSPAGSIENLPGSNGSESKIANPQPGEERSDLRVNPCLPMVDRSPSSGTIENRHSKIENANAPLPLDAPLLSFEKLDFAARPQESSTIQAPDSDISDGASAVEKLPDPMGTEPASENFIHPDLLHCTKCNFELPPLLPNGERPSQYCPGCKGVLRHPATLHFYCPTCRGSIRDIWNDDGTRTSDRCPICYSDLPPVDVLLKRPAPAPQPEPAPPPPNARAA